MAPSENVLTFCFTDIEGSTRLLARLGPSDYEPVLEMHRELLRRSWAAHHGREVRHEGDGSFVVFTSAADAVAAAVDAQLALQRHDWGPGRTVRIRIGLHTGEANETSDGDYIGFAVHEAARVGDAANGGQIVVSAVTAAAAQPLPEYTALTELGSFRLKDVDGPCVLYRVEHPDLDVDGRPPRAPSSAVHNLPIIRTAFIGRHDELEELVKLVAGHPLVTVVGPGGVGKTRMAIEAAAASTGRFTDGAWLIELDGVSTDDAVVARIAGALGVSEQPGADPSGSIVEHLRSRTTLLVIDNCEHVLDPVARIVDSILSTCADVAVLATSREPLLVRGERTWRLDPLTVPGRDDLDLERLQELDAVRLFVDRAKLADASFELRADTAAAVAQVCRRLDGIPLALELAAAQLRGGTIDSLVVSLDDRFDALVSGYRTDHPRQRTLRAAIAWSHDLLDDDEQVLFRRLSVFRSGATLDAIEDVCGVQGGSLSTLHGLVERSLVVPDDERYRMLESVAAFAAERLQESGEAGTIAARHRGHYIRFARDARASGDDDVVVRELDNLRAALAFGDDESMLELANLLAPLWSKRGPFHEGHAWLQRAVDANPPSGERAEAVLMLAQLSSDMGRHDDARRIIEEALEWYRANGDVERLGEALFRRASFSNAQARFDEAVTLLTEARDWAEEHDLMRWFGLCEHALAHVGLNTGNLADAAEHAAAAYRALERGGESRDVALALTMMGRIDAARGRVAEARPSLERATELFAEAGEETMLAFVRWNLGSVKTALGDHHGAVEDLREALTAMDEAGDAYAPLANVNLAYSLFHAGEVDEAWRELARAMPRVESPAFPIGPAYGLTVRAEMANARGDFALAADDARRALIAFRELGSVADLLPCAARLAIAWSGLGRHARAVKLCAAVNEQQRAIGYSADASDMDDEQRLRAAAIDALGADEVVRLETEGAALTLDDLVAFASDEGADP